MKRNIFILIILLFTVQLFSQVNATLEFSKDYYLQKSKKQNTTGWILLTSGAVIGIIGIVGFSKSDFLESNSDADAYGILMLGGALSGLGSIPFFINSGSNARKAATLSINNQPIILQNGGSLVLSPQPSLSLKIKF